MDLLNRTDLQELIEQTGEWCISLYMPVHPIGSEQQQNPIRLKNLLTRLKKDLSESGMRRPGIEALVQPAEQLLLDPDFWQHQSEGLAVFLSNNFSRTYRLPAKLEELLIIANNFHIKPLLPLLSTEGKFYILAINLNGIRLFLATKDTINEIELTGMRTSMEEALWMDEPEKHLDLHSTGSSTGKGRAGGRPAIFHGQGVGEDDKTNILRFFHYFDQDLSALLEDKSTLIIPAGVDYLLPLYREATTYNNLLEKELIGAPEKLPLKELHKRAWQIIEPIFRGRQQQAIQQFEELNGQQSDLAASDLDIVVKAASFGQVGTLFVPLGIQKWGRYDPENNKVLQEPEPRPENEDLLDFAAIHTILNSGQVYAVQSEELPGNGELAAILRYAV
jgi:release factor family 7